MLHKGRNSKKRLAEHKQHFMSGLLGSATKVRLDGTSEPKKSVKLDDEDGVTKQKKGD